MLISLSSCVEQSATTSTSQSPKVESILTSATVAYADMELVLAQSDIYQQEGLPLKQRTDTTQQDWVKKDQKLQEDAQSLQSKYQNGLITTANAQREQQEIESRAKALQEAAQRQAQEIDQENAIFAARAQRLLRQAVNSVNADKRYSMIIDAAYIIDADTTLNISNLILTEINTIYSAEKSSTKK